MFRKFLLFLLLTFLLFLLIFLNLNFNFNFEKEVWDSQIFIPHYILRYVFPVAGVFLPFTNREDVDFFSHVEMHLRQEHPPLLGRDHLAYRSYYFPVKDVIDGDLCEQFAQVGSLLLILAFP